MGEIATAFNTAFRETAIANDPNSGAHKPVKSEIRAIGAAFEAHVADEVQSALDTAFENVPDEIYTESGNPLSFPDGLRVNSVAFEGSTDGSVQFEIGDVTSGDSHWKVEAGASNGGPVLAAKSDTDSNVPCNYAAKGTGAHYFGNGNGNLFAILDSGGVTTSMPTVKAAITGADNPVVYGVDSSETNKGVAVAPKGNAPITAADPDSTSAGGNARGNYATDWQRDRSAAAQVASGADSAIVGGRQNTASGVESVAGGASNTASGQASTVFGNACTGSGFAACVIGNACTGSGNYTRAGGIHALAQILGKDAWSSGGFSSAQGSNQHAKQTLQATTTDATQTAMTADGGAAGGTNQIQLQNNSVMTFTALICARDGAGAKFAGYKIEGVIRRNAAAANTVLLASTVTVLYETNAAWDCDCVAGTGQGILNIRVTGEAALTVYWGATVQFHELVHA